MIQCATPSSDFPPVAAALAGRDVLMRALERRAPTIARAARTVATYEREVEALGAEYRRLLSTIQYLEVRVGVPARAASHSVGGLTK